MRLYRALLLLYPTSFRHEYGAEMSAVFATQLRDASSVFARLAIWSSALIEIIRGAAAVHFDILRRDLSVAGRQVRRAPGFAVTAVLLIALGTGANTAVFAVADFVLLRPLAFPQSDRLVRLWESVPGYQRMELSPPNYEDWKARMTSLESFGALTLTAANLSGDSGPPQRLEGAIVSGEVFEALGVPPLAGRTIEQADIDVGLQSTVVLSHALWQSRFGGDAGIIGRTVRLDGQPLEVVGIMPRDFVFPSRDVAFWAPLIMGDDDRLDRNNNFLTGVARLAPGVSLETARQELDRVALQLESEHPVENEGARGALVPIRSNVSSDDRLMLFALVAAAICVLLIAGVNLANLTMARALARQRELAVRTALGAGRERLARQLITETLAVIALGGVAGVALGALSVPLLLRLVPDALPMTGAPGLNGRVVAVAVLAMLIVGLGAGLTPLLRAGRRTIVGLSDAGRSGGLGGERARGVLVGVGIASSVLLLVVTGLLMRTLWTLQGVETGFQSQGVLAVRTALPMPEFAETAGRVQWFRDVVERVEALPGVSDAAYISFAPQTMGGGIWPVVLDAGDVRREEGQVASIRFVTPGFFDTLSVPLHQGRDVAWSDDTSQLLVAVVSESFVERFFPDTPALGARFEFAFAERTIVGVVGNVSNRGPEQDTEPQVYLPAGQVADGSLSFYAPKDLVVKSSMPRAGLEAGIRRIVAERSPEQPVSDVRTLSAIVRDQTASRAVQLWVLGAFAAVALVLAGIGLHGLLAFVVSQRSREIGVRMALGADRTDVVRMVVGRTAWLLGIGLVPGLLAAGLAGAALGSVLVGVTASDPAVYAVAVLLCVLTAGVGCALPARRAARVEPAAALRAE